MATDLTPTTRRARLGSLVRRAGMALAIAAAAVGPAAAAAAAPGPPDLSTTDQQAVEGCNPLQVGCDEAGIPPDCNDLIDPCNGPGRGTDPDPDPEPEPEPEPEPVPTDHGDDPVAATPAFTG